MTDCETDTKSLLNSDHYPVIASCRIKFTAVQKIRHSQHRYNNTALWKNKVKLNEDLRRYKLEGTNNYRTYKDWIEANKTAVDEQTPKEQKQKLEYSSEATKNAF